MLASHPSTGFFPCEQIVRYRPPGGPVAGTKVSWEKRILIDAGIVSAMNFSPANGR
jgi:hypothetical protein